MINITVYGLDQFVVGNISKDFTDAIAKVYEVDEDEINFIATNSMVFHKGVDQTSWNVIVVVSAPMKLRVLQSEAQKVIFYSFIGPAIHVEIKFEYYSEDHRLISVNKEYPRYITESNTVDTDQDYDEDIEEGEEDDEIFTGDIFKGLKH